MFETSRFGRNLRPDSNESYGAQVSARVRAQIAQETEDAQSSTFLFEPTDNEVAKPGRTWFDRVFAPFEAPQQALYSLTKDIAEDGFQFKDLWNAASHGARYFNPWSETERITEDEINTIFFGEDSAMSRGVAGLATNLGIALLYDPLLVGGLVAKGARAAGASANLVSAIDRVSNPAGVALEGIGAAARAAAPIAQDAARAVLGERRSDAASTAAAIWFRAPSKNLSPEAYELFQRAQTQTQANRVQAAALIKKAKGLGQNGDAIMLDALQNRAIRESVLPTENFKTTARARENAMEELTNRLEAEGIDKDLFHNVMEQFSGLAAKQEDELFRMGVIDPSEMAVESGRHLRLSYNMRQSPVDALRRIDRLQAMAEANPERYGRVLKESSVFDRVALHRSLTAAADELADASNKMGRAFQDTIAGTQNRSVRQRYFPTRGSTRTINVDNMVEDLGKYIDTHPEHSISDAMDFMRKEMFGGTSMPDGFSEVIAKYLADGMITRAPLDSWKAKFETFSPGSNVDFRRWATNEKALQDRLGIYDEIATDVLGRQDSALVRMVDQIEAGGREAIMQSLVDDIAGVARVQDETIQEARKIILDARNRVGVSRFESNASVAKTFAQDPGVHQAYIDAAAVFKRAFPNMSDEMALQYARRSVGSVQDGENTLQALKHGDIVERGVDGLASLPDVPEDVRKALGHTSRIDDARFPELEGMYVSPFVAHQLNQVVRISDKLGGLAGGAEGVGASLLNAMRSAVSHFKFFKIVMDPAAHFRDTVGALTSMDIMGVNSFRPEIWQEAIKSSRRYMRGEIDEYVELAQSVGYDIFSTSMSASEVAGTALRQAGPLVDDAMDWMDATKNFWNEVGGIFQGSRNAASNLYQVREGALRSYVFIGKYKDLEEGARRAGTEITRELQQNMARQAAELTNATMFNYADVPLIVDTFRSLGIAPFLTFPVKAAGQFADSLYNRPWSVLKYDRAYNAWNNHWAGGDEAFAKEIQALPEHMRDNLVVRLPWENKEGNALYLDLSYFLPWSAVRDLTTEVLGPVHAVNKVLGGRSSEEFNEEGNTQVSAQAEGAFRGGGGGGIFSPPALQLVNAFASGVDGLGRPIYEETDAPETKAAKMGRYLWQFIAPPIAPGGVTSDSVGRSILAAARTSSEPVNWLEYLGLGMRLGNDAGVLNRYGEAPTARAAPTLSDSAPAQAALGLSGLFLPVSESNAERQVRNSIGGQRAAQGTLNQQIRRVATDPNMSAEGKQAEIARLMREYQQQAADAEAYRSFLGW